MSNKNKNLLQNKELKINQKAKLSQAKQKNPENKTILKTSMNK